MVRLSSGLLDRNISSSRGFYAYLAFSVAHSNKKKANEHIAWLLKLLAQLFPHMEVAERNLQLNGCTIEVGSDGQAKGFRACLDGQPQQLPLVPRLPFILNFYDSFHV